MTPAGDLVHVLMTSKEVVAMNRIETRPAQSDAASLTLSVSEAANLLGVSRDLVYELVAEGELPALRLGRRIVLPRRALEELVNGADLAKGERAGSRGAASLQGFNPPAPLDRYRKRTS
jgi:excisionase family DNA binding protein